MNLREKNKIKKILEKNSKIQKVYFKKINNKRTGKEEEWMLIRTSKMTVINYPEWRNLTREKLNAGRYMIAIKIAGKKDVYSNDYTDYIFVSSIDYLFYTGLNSNTLYPHPNISIYDRGFGPVFSPCISEGQSEISFYLKKRNYCGLIFLLILLLRRPNANHWRLDFSKMKLVQKKTPPEFKRNILNFFDINKMIEEYKKIT